MTVLIIVLIQIAMFAAGFFLGLSQIYGKLADEHGKLADSWGEISDAWDRVRQEELKQARRYGLLTEEQLKVYETKPN